MNKHTEDVIPRWDLSTIYQSFTDKTYIQDKDCLKNHINTLQKLLETPIPRDGKALLSLIQVYEQAQDVAENLKAYAEIIYTTDTRNAQVLAEINILEALRLPLKRLVSIFYNRLAEQKEQVLHMAASTEALKPYTFFLTESLEKAAFQMTPNMEDLANDLSRSGGDAWTRLHNVVTSTTQGLWDPETGEWKTVIALRDLAHSPDRSIRERAYKAELEAWRTVEIPLAAALNGVKGVTITLDSRRGWKTADGNHAPLRKACFQSRISEKTLGALITALEGSIPLFRRYLNIKARLLGIKACAFYDLFAPVGDIGGKKWSWQEAADFITHKFAGFDTEMSVFAGAAFSAHWIDAEIREGKVGGAYCESFPLAKQSRILCNFDGSFDSVMTLAHELGHAWHSKIINGLPRSQSQYPMTLAETASILAETVVFEGALQQADPSERLGLLEGNLKDACQVIIDILSRFYFEKALFEKRETAELSPEELCGLMLEAQQKTYGDGLDPNLLHPYMWAVKSHYYDISLAFYNYPYALGLLLALSLYGKSQKEKGAEKEYRQFLGRTGMASVEDVARSVGFNIEDTAFWQQGIDLIARRVDELEQLASKQA